MSKTGFPPDSRLTFIRSENTPGRRRIVCACTCGVVKSYIEYAVRIGKTKSCGCFRVDTSRARATKHGHGGKNNKTVRHSNLYSIWSSMVQRCKNPNNAAYKYYGERGISVDDKWTDFSGFLKEMGPGYVNGLSIERINVNGNYCKENCVWIDRSLQSKNTRKNRRVSLYGHTEIASDWCGLLDIDASDTTRRLNAGESPYCAILSMNNNRRKGSFQERMIKVWRHIITRNNVDKGGALISDITT